MIRLTMSLTLTASNTFDMNSYLTELKRSLQLVTNNWPYELSFLLPNLSTARVVRGEFCWIMRLACVNTSVVEDI